MLGRGGHAGGSKGKKSQQKLYGSSSQKKNICMSQQPAECCACRILLSFRSFK